MLMFNDSSDADCNVPPIQVNTVNLLVVHIPIWAIPSNINCDSGLSKVDRNSLDMLWWSIPEGGFIL